MARRRTGRRHRAYWGTGVSGEQAHTLGPDQAEPCAMHLQLDTMSDDTSVGAMSPDARSHGGEPDSFAEQFAEATAGLLRWAAGGGKALPKEDRRLAAGIAEERNRLRPGAVYLISDGITGRTGDSSKVRPNVVVGTDLQPEDVAAVTARRRVWMISRTAWKDHWASPPEGRAWGTISRRGGPPPREGGVYCPEVPPFTCGGIFEYQRMVGLFVREIVLHGEFKGWVCPEALALLIVNKSSIGGQLDDPYQGACG